MIVAIDPNCVIPGKVGGLENYVLALIDALLAHAAQVQQLVLVTRPENHELFQRFADARCEVLGTESGRGRQQDDVGTTSDDLLICVESEELLRGVHLYPGRDPL